MVKTKQFNARMYYVTPSCKSAEIRTKKSILAGSYGEAGKAAGSGDVDIDEEDY